MTEQGMMTAGNATTQDVGNGSTYRGVAPPMPIVAYKSTLGV